MKPLKKILFINWQDKENPDAGGAEVHLHEVAERFVRDGISCTAIVSKFKGASDHSVQNGLDIYRHGRRWNFNFVVLFSFKKWVKHHNPDLIVDDSNKIPFFLAMQTKTAVVVRIHHLFREVIFKEASFPAALYVYIMETLALKSWKNLPVLTVSKSTQDDLRKSGVLNSAIALNGVDFESYQKLAHVEKKPYQLLYLGRIKKYKGLDMLIRVVVSLKDKFPELNFVIAGMGDDVPRLKKMVADLGANGYIHFAGFLSREGKMELYNESCVALNSSLKEGYGLTTIEANACGTCVVATDVPGLRDSILNGKTGFLSPLGNEIDFEKKVEILLSDSKKRQEMESNAIEWAKSHNWEATYQASRRFMEQVYERGQTT